MIPKDLFEKVRRIEIKTSRLVTDVFAGQYHSVFKGRGIEFDEVREYLPGDDIRTIDWNVTARTGKPHIKKYVEEREMTVMILVDVSPSCRFATVNDLKSRLAAEIASVLAFSATRNNDKVGLIIFTDKIEKFIPPRKGLKHVLRIIREVLYFNPEGQKTDINQALECLNKVTKRRSVAFVISDFFEEEESFLEKDSQEVDFKRAMTIANKRHDIIAITLNDPSEINLPSCGLLSVKDAETGKERLIDTTNRKVRQRYHEDALSRLLRRNRLFQTMGVDHIDISTDASYADAIAKFFITRKRRHI